MFVFNVHFAPLVYYCRIGFEHLKHYNLVLNLLFFLTLVILERWSIMKSVGLWGGSRPLLAWWLVLVVSIAAVVGPRVARSDESSADGLPANYWTLPVPSQGEASADWSDLERSLAPEACAACHEDQYAQWRTSLHAAAFSPGLVGQLVSMSPTGAGSCMRCHAPLAEQGADFTAALTAGTGHLPERQGLASRGIVCAACHLRSHRRFGPPQRDTGATGQSDPDDPHGGVFRSAWFESSEFCAACHQFPQTFAVNGKPLQNTVAEWQASRFALQGVTCQGCHMPGRRHLWRGIHDPEMVASGLTARFVAAPEGARFSLTNSGVGHAFPTYVTPRVEMRGVLLDAAGYEVPDSAVQHVIVRQVSYGGGGWVERRDSRLLPGGIATLTLPWLDYAHARLWLEVWPDHYYDTQVYDALLAGLAPGSSAFDLISRADGAAQASSFRLFVTEVERP